MSITFQNPNIYICRVYNQKANMTHDSNLTWTIITFICTKKELCIVLLLHIMKRISPIWNIVLIYRHWSQRKWSARQSWKYGSCIDIFLSYSSFAKHFWAHELNFVPKSESVWHIWKFEKYLCLDFNGFDFNAPGQVIVAWLKIWTTNSQQLIKLQ